MAKSSLDSFREIAGSSTKSGTTVENVLSKKRGEGENPLNDIAESMLQIKESVDSQLKKLESPDVLEKLSDLDKNFESYYSTLLELQNKLNEFADSSVEMSEKDVAEMRSHLEALKDIETGVQEQKDSDSEYNRRMLELEKETNLKFDKSLEIQQKFNKVEKKWNLDQEGLWKKISENIKTLSTSTIGNVSTSLAKGMMGPWGFMLHDAFKDISESLKGMPMLDKFEDKMRNIFTSKTNAEKIKEVDTKLTGVGNGLALSSKELTEALVKFDGDQKIATKKEEGFKKSLGTYKVDEEHKTELEAIMNRCSEQLETLVALSDSYIKSNLEATDLQGDKLSEMLMYLKSSAEESVGKTDPKEFKKSLDHVIKTTLPKTLYGVNNILTTDLSKNLFEELKEAEASPSKDSKTLTQFIESAKDEMSFITSSDGKDMIKSSLGNSDKLKDINKQLKDVGEETLKGNLTLSEALKKEDTLQEEKKQTRLQEKTTRELAAVKGQAVENELDMKTLVDGFKESWDQEADFRDQQTQNFSKLLGTIRSSTASWIGALIGPLINLLTSGKVWELVGKVLNKYVWEPIKEFFGNIFGPDSFIGKLISPIVELLREVTDFLGITDSEEESTDPDDPSYKKASQSRLGRVGSAIMKMSPLVAGFQGIKDAKKNFADGNIWEGVKSVGAALVPGAGSLSDLKEAAFGDYEEAELTPIQNSGVSGVIRSVEKEEANKEKERQTNNQPPSPYNPAGGSPQGGRGNRSSVPQFGDDSDAILLEDNLGLQLVNKGKF